jgi:hypothetical protein
MNSLIIYLLGVSTPFILLFLYELYIGFLDQLNWTEYCKLYREYTTEYDNLSNSEKDIFSKTREWDDPQYAEGERARYFHKRYYNKCAKENLIK